MKLNYDRKSKDPTYFIQHGFRIGKKTTTVNVARIGKHSELLAITDDPLQYAKDQVAKYNEQFKNQKVEMSFTVDFDKKLPFSDSLVSDSTALNVGYLFLQAIYHDLEIDSFFDKIAEEYKVQFDCDTINRFVIFSRILWPGSKLYTVRNLSKFYEQPSFEYQHVLRFMDILFDHYDEYMTHLFNASSRIIPRDTSVVFYDCTNFYCEIECEDEDYIDEVTGDFIKGLRKYGVSKEHRPNPIVQMGLLIDRNGIPINMCMNSGSDNEQKSAIPLEKKALQILGEDRRRFIYCADAGLGSYPIRKFNSEGGRAFIITQSVKMLKNIYKQAVFNDFDYKLLSDDTPVSLEKMKTFDRHDPDNLHLYEDKIYKVIEVETLEDVGLYEEKTYKNGNTRMVKSKAVFKQRVIITFSRKMMEYQRTVRNRQIERAEKLLETKDPEEIKKGPNDVRRFIKRTSKEKEPVKYEMDEARVREEEKYDGFYAIATNLQDPAKDIIAIHAGREKIEEEFRIMKSYFDTRPFHHSLRNRIGAHLMFCYTALLIYRILEAKVDNEGTHYTIDNILETLTNMNVNNVQNAYYQAGYTGSQILTALCSAFPALKLDRQYYQASALNKYLKKIS